MNNGSLSNKLALISSVFASVAGIVTATVEIVAHGGTFLHYLYIASYYIGAFIVFTAVAGFWIYYATGKLVLALTISGAFTLYLLFAPKPQWMGGLEPGQSGSLIFDVIAVVIGLVTLVIAVISVLVFMKEGGK